MKLQTNYNPDVLSCLANLSNDEVFTPPALVNQILDLLPKELWSDKDAKFLDPVSKSGVFLREITLRLIDGLEKEIPDRQERINHICQNQIYGIAITELTSLLSRRSVYCSKKANGKYSIGDNFKNEQGNIIFKRVEHTWQNGKCIFCNANQSEYDRDDALESHAYRFIHEDNPSIIFKNMKFDVIIGNPPYQLNDGGGLGTSATPIYQKFVEQAKKLNPRYLTMIIPARWYSGGKGLDDFRKNMLEDNRMRQIVDFPEAIDCFPGVQIKGGVCYFLWDRDNQGNCTVSTSRKGEIVSEMARPLLEVGAETFIRYNEAISILKKVQAFKEPSLSENISSRKPFGLDSNFANFSKQETKTRKIKLYRYGEIGYIDESQVLKNKKLIRKTKVLISKAGSGSDTFPHQILGVPIIAKPNSICTETYLVVGDFDNKTMAENLVSYICTRFFRFMVSLTKNTQNAPKGVYVFVPVQDMKQKWTDEKLYQKYGITKKEQSFIESLIRPMDI
ncbi:MAG: Eco57I restriction-modification methylase domain-containing protein [Candidatus Paceibacterota bacterium]